MVLITLALRRPKQGGLTLEKLTAPGEKKREIPAILTVHFQYSDAEFWV